MEEVARDFQDLTVSELCALIPIYERHGQLLDTRVRVLRERGAEDVQQVRVAHAMLRRAISGMEEVRRPGVGNGVSARLLRARITLQGLAEVAHQNNYRCQVLDERAAEDASFSAELLSLHGHVLAAVSPVAAGTPHRATEDRLAWQWRYLCLSLLASYL